MEPKVDYKVVEAPQEVQTPQEKELSLHNAVAESTGEIEKAGVEPQVDYKVTDEGIAPLEQQSQVEEVKDLQTDQVVEEKTEQPVLEKVGSEVPKAQQPSSTNELPEGIEKLLEFMNDTGGTLEDYTKLNRDFESISDDALLKEYYKSTKPGFSDDDIDLMIDDRFSVDGDVEEDSREYKLAQLKKKEAVLEAKLYLEDRKSKYYNDLKSANRSVDVQQSEALAAQEKIAQENYQYFTDKTNEVFSDDFKGFVFETDGGKFRYGINDVNSVKEFQSDIQNFYGKFLDDSGKIKDAQAYHKSLWAANNADKIAKFFYNQGHADAIKADAKESKHVDVTPKSHPSPGGNKAPYRVVETDNSQNRLSIKGFNQ